MSNRQTRTAAPSKNAVDAPPQRTFMDKWIEPSLRAPAPSFTDYPHLKIERHGVLENMAPLGTMPSQKIKLKNLKPEGGRRMLVIKKPDSVASTPTPAARELVTPEPVIQPVRKGSEPRKLVDDAEWAPKTPVAQTSRRQSFAQSSAGRQSQPPQATPTMSLSFSPSKEDTQLQRADRVIESACEEAITQGRYATAYALRTLYNDHRSNARIVRLIELVFLQEADEVQLAEFRKLMSYKKKEGAKDDRATKYFDAHDNVYTPTDLFKSSWTFTSPSSKRAVTTEAPNHISKSAKSSLKEIGHINKKPKVTHSRQNNTFILNKTPTNGMMAGSSRPTSRSRSISSSSSLSSLDEEILRRELTPSADEPGQLSQTDANTAEILARDHQQPMTHDKALGPKLHSFPTTTSVTSSTSTRKITDTNDMPELSEGIPDSESRAAPPSRKAKTKAQKKKKPGFVTHEPEEDIKPNAKSQKKKDGGIVVREPEEDNEELIEGRKRAKRITNYGFDDDAKVYQSSIRHAVATQNLESEFEIGLPVTKPTKQLLRLRNHTKPNNEFEDFSSPTTLSFQHDVGPGSSLNSRAGTPNPSGRPARKGKSTGPRMKTSPVKKGAGTSAGIPRASGERNSPTGNGTFPNAQDNNDDYCSSCGGNGDLVCCDGCTRSFHLRCVDPPMAPGQLSEDWFCNVCVSKRKPTIHNPTGAFGQLLFNLDKKNPMAFHLPKPVREYFDGVRTGTEGEYEDESVTIVSKAKNRTGYDEAPDYFKTRDAKGNPILCHNCHKGPEGEKFNEKQPIITCSLCSLHWHLDCLDPPLANPPQSSRRWKCPCHVDDELENAPGSLAPAHRFRRVKGASVIIPAITRGTRNNGHIEVELSPSDDEEDEEFTYQAEFGKVYKLPEKGIKLDFISRIYSLRAAEAASAAAAYSTPPRSDTEIFKTRHDSKPFNHHQLAEQQAALNLAQLATRDPNDGTRSLIDALISEAPPALVAMIAQGDAASIAKTNSPCDAMDTQSLLAMKALIDRRLEMINSIAEEAGAKVEQKNEDEDNKDVEMLM